MEGNPSCSSDDEKLLTDSDEQKKTLHNEESSQGTDRSLLRRIGGVLRGLFDPHQSAHGYVIILLLCVARLCIIFGIDNPAPLESAILGVMKIDITRYELLYAVYSWPNAIVPLLGGILIDKVVGLRIGFLIFFAIASVRRTVPGCTGCIS